VATDIGLITVVTKALLAMRCHLVRG
jgi:hypothetical protein